jgi:hypothetical protein
MKRERERGFVCLFVCFLFFFFLGLWLFSWCGKNPKSSLKVSQFFCTEREWEYRIIDFE